MAQNKQKKAGFATLVGRPNVGKSTLMNHLIGQKIAITSNKPQTTRNRIQTVYTGPKGQIVFLDTPGIHKAKNKLGNYMVKVAESTFSDVDVILWLVEPTTYIGAGERHILEQLKRSRLPVILVINKIDTVPKTAVLDAMETYRKEMDFAEIVPVSALRSNNTDTLLDCIFKYLPYGEPFYDEDTITDQPQRQIVAEMIRERHCAVWKRKFPTASQWRSNGWNLRSISSISMRRSSASGIPTRELLSASRAACLKGSVLRRAGISRICWNARSICSSGSRSRRTGETAISS